jgi:hypothetical protein
LALSHNVGVVEELRAMDSFLAKKKGWKLDAWAKVVRCSSWKWVIYNCFASEGI